MTNEFRVEYVAHSGSDLLCVDAARASFGKQSEWGETLVEGEDEHGRYQEVVKSLKSKDAKLIDYLAREKHLLPFRHPHLTLRCSAPIFLARQLGKHQTGMSWSEESRRYIKTPPEFYWPKVWRKAAADVKQGSSDEVFNVEGIVVEYGDSIVDEQDLNYLTTKLYTKLLDSGCAPELARMILPQNMMVTWVWTGSLLSWVHMIKQRSEATAQKEAQEFAGLVEKIVHEHYPVSYEALMRH